MGQNGFLATDIEELWKIDDGTSTSLIETYQGYDEKNEKVSGARKTAEDAHKVLRVNDLYKACQAAEESFKQEFSNISKEVGNLADDTERGLIINGLSLKPKVLESAENMLTKPKISIRDIWQKYVQVNSKANKLQQELNKEAKAWVQGRAGVKKVKKV